MVVADDDAPDQQVVSGGTGAIDALVPHLGSRGVRCVRLNVSGAFHSPLMRQAQRELARHVEGFVLSPPRVPVIANATARPHPARTAPRDGG